MSSVPQLPNEVFESILLRIPPLSYSKESVRTLCHVGQANSRFLAISRLPHIWKPHFIVQWHRSDAVREELRRSSTNEDWCRMYSIRSRIDCRALHLLDAIVVRTDDRNVLAAELAKDLGYDAYEVLSRETSRVRFHDIEEKDNHDTYSVPVEGLTRQYWAKEVLGVISRIRAIDIWLPLVHMNSLADVSFEKGLAALSAFFGEDIDKIFEEFDRLASNCQVYLSSLGPPEAIDATETIVQICAWMRQQGFVKTDLTNYYNLLNHFPHRVLFEQPVTLPISLVYVFVCIARRLGINAHPVAFPHKVLAVVTLSAGEAIYVDVFESATRPILSYSSDLPFMLHGMGINPHALTQYAAPAPTSTMVLRAAANIIHSLDRVMLWSEGDQMAAHYAAYCAALLFTGDARLVGTLFVMGVGGPLDNEVVLKNAIRPALSGAARDELDRFLADQGDSDTNEPRAREGHEVRHFTGMMFRHKTYSYVGLIKGWDYRCEAGDEWIRRMRVDDLTMGRDQPFYRSLTPDGHIRYVAEENIEPITHVAISDIRVLINTNKEVGRWFDGVEFTASGGARYILSAESRVIYPEDDAAGRAFLAEQSD